MNQIEIIVDAVRKYLLQNKVKILIGTPCFGGMLHNGYFQSMLELSANFTRLGIPFEVITIGNESLIQRARNGIVARFMADSTATHLMFIDADITFSWISIVKLLLGNKELSGGCYPKKCFNWDKIKHHNQKNPNLKEDELMAKSLDYVFNPIYHQEGANIVIRLENGMAQVKDIGTGFMMIQKSVIRKMMVKYPDTKYKNNVAGYGQNGMNDYFYSLFDCCIDPVSRVYLSEDYLFCKRWIDIGGELWLDVNTNLNHTGIIDYKGCLGLIIGEIDILNKDAQVLRQQAQITNTANSNSIGNATSNSTTNANTNATNNSTSNATSNSTNNATTNTTQKKKKKKNKKKNANASITNTGTDAKEDDDNSNGEEENIIETANEPIKEQPTNNETSTEYFNNFGNHC